jgi:hypothetical protein
MLRKLKYCALNVVNDVCTHGEDQLEVSGPAVLAGGHGNAFVIIVRNVAKAQVLCPKCGK